MKGSLLDMANGPLSRCIRRMLCSGCHV